MWPIEVIAVLLAGHVYVTAGHGYVAFPPLRGGVAGNDDNGYCPHCGNGASVCGDGGQWPPGSDFLNYGAETLTNLQAGSIHEFSVYITAHHKGHFEFAICDQHVSGDLADPQACFDARKLHRADPPADCVPNDVRGDCQPIQGDYPERWYLPPSAGTHTMRFKIPSDLSCESCTLQWRWWTANSCVPAPNYGCFFDLLDAQGWDVSQWCGSYCGECGDYEPGHYTCGEEFRNCADVAVNGGSPVSTTTAGATTASTATNSATPTAPATTATTSPSTGTCVWNRDCVANAWCNDPTYEAWCPLQGQTCPYPQCIIHDTTPSATTTTTQAPTTTTTTQAPPASTTTAATQTPSTTEATTTAATQAPSTTEATTTAATQAPSTTEATTPVTGGACVWNRDCATNAWCNDPAYEAWCPLQGQNCPNPQCIIGDTTPSATTTTTQAPTTTTTTQAPPTSTTTAATQAPSTTEATTTAATQAPSTTMATTPVTGGACVWNRDCAANAWCNDPAYEAWCPPQGQNCPYPQCVSSDTTVPPATTSTTMPQTTTPATSSSGSRSTTFLGTTTTTTASAPGQECVSQAMLQCINDASSYWPKCSASQSKENAGPVGYEFGFYCTQEWADALNEVLRDPLVGKCGNSSATHILLAQIAYETGYFSTLFQPIDGGAGLIHMIPQNWPINVGHIDELWPDMDYSAKLASMQEKFFQTPAYGWKSVAAWYLRTNHVIPGCEGKNLFELDMDAQTRCILGRVVDRSESYNIVGNCMAAV